MATLSQQPIRLRTDVPGVDAEISHLIEQLRQERIDGVRDYLARTRASGDWQDRLYVLGQIAAHAPAYVLNAACEAEPEAADVFVLRCAYFAELSITMRGTGTANQVKAANMRSSAAAVQAAMASMAKSTQLDGQDPTAYALVLRPLSIFGQAELQKRAFDRATAIAPGLVAAHLALTTAHSERWGGSHNASLQFARLAMTKAGPGSDMAACLFWAHDLVRTHFMHFNKDVPGSLRYAADSGVAGELNSALEAWLAPPYVARRSSTPFLGRASAWYRAVSDADRFKRIAALTGEEFKEADFSAARQFAGAKRGGLLGWIYGSSH